MRFVMGMYLVIVVVTGGWKTVVVGRIGEVGFVGVVVGTTGEVGLLIVDVETVTEVVELVSVDLVVVEYGVGVVSVFDE